MSKPHHDRKAMENFLGMIEVIKDPEKYEAAINELITKFDQVKEMVELVAPAKEIEKARSQAHADRAASIKLVADANKKVRTILANADNLIKRKNDEVEMRLEKVLSKEKKLAQKVSVESDRLSAEDERIKARELASDKQHSQGDKMLQEGRALKAEYKARLKKIKEAAS